MEPSDRKNPAAPGPVRIARAASGTPKVPLFSLETSVGTALLVTVCLLVLDRPPGVAAIGLTVAATLFLVRVEQRSAVKWVVTAAAFRSRTRREDRSSGSLQVGGLVSGRRVEEIQSLSGAVGVISVGRRSSLVLSARPHAPPNADRADSAHIGELLDELAPLVRTAGIALDGIAVHSVLTAAGPAPDDHVVGLRRDGPAAAALSIYVVLRMDPSRCPDAIQARGGGSLGLHRSLVASADRAVARGRWIGWELHALDAAALADGISEVGGSRDGGGDGVRSVGVVQEHWRHHEVGRRWHRTVQVIRVSSGRPGELTSIGRFRSSKARQVVATWLLTETASGVVLNAHVRLTAADTASLDAAEDELRTFGRAHGLKIVVLPGGQREGFTGSLPIGSEC